MFSRTRGRSSAHKTLQTNEATKTARLRTLACSSRTGTSGPLKWPLERLGVVTQLAAVVEHSESMLESFVVVSPVDAFFVGFQYP